MPMVSKVLMAAYVSFDLPVIAGVAIAPRRIFNFTGFMRVISA